MKSYKINNILLKLIEQTIYHLNFIFSNRNIWFWPSIFQLDLFFDNNLVFFNFLHNITDATFHVCFIKSLIESKKKYYLTYHTLLYTFLNQNKNQLNLKISRLPLFKTKRCLEVIKNRLK